MDSCHPFCHQNTATPIFAKLATNSHLTAAAAELATKLAKTATNLWHTIEPCESMACL